MRKIFIITLAAMTALSGCGVTANLGASVEAGKIKNQSFRVSVGTGVYR